MSPKGIWGKHQAAWFSKILFSLYYLQCLKVLAEKQSYTLPVRRKTEKGKGVLVTNLYRACNWIMLISFFEEKTKTTNNFYQFLAFGMVPDILVSWCKVSSDSVNDPPYSTRHPLRYHWNRLPPKTKTQGLADTV